MTVELNANFVSDFNRALPRNRDLIKEGDDHIRLVKSVLQNTFPGMNAAVRIDSAKLNKWHETFTYEGSTLNINNSVQVASNKTLNLGANKLTNIGDATEPMDAVNLRTLQGSLVWPIGSIFMTVDSRNPKEILGFGTWEKFAAGRMIVGTGTSLDNNNESRTVVNEARGGNYSMQLLEEHTPPHKHTVDIESKGGGAHKHDAGFAIRQVEDCSVYGYVPDKGKISYEHHQYNSSGRPYTAEAVNHTHKVEGSTELFGKGGKFEIIPPYIGVNIWKRIADA